MRRPVTHLAALAALASVVSLAAGLLVLAAPPASAGGPTSVLVVNYDGNRASAALTGSTLYSDLETALDPSTTPSGEKLAPAAFMNTPIRLTWMIHDVTPWRVDAISIVGTDVWVETTADAGSGQSLFETPTIRHRAKDAGLLVATLTALGVYGQQNESPSATPSPTRPAVAAAAASDAVAVDVAPTVAPATEDLSSIPWWATAAIAVLALGIGVVLGRRGRYAAADPTQTPPAEPAAPVGFSRNHDPAGR